MNSFIIEWNPPYSATNNDSDVHVDPHVIQYTVYCTDNYTGNSIFTVNVTETQFTLNASDNDVCPMYHVSAWNADGESNMSVCIPHSK